MTENFRSKDYPANWIMTPRLNTIAKIPRRMRQTLTLFCAKHVLTPETPVTREEVVDYLKKAGHRNVDDSFKEYFLLPL